MHTCTHAHTDAHTHAHTQSQTDAHAHRKETWVSAYLDPFWGPSVKGDGSDFGDVNTQAAMDP